MTKQNKPTEPQKQFYDDQDFGNISIDELFNKLIVPIDNNRSHFNAMSINVSDEIKQSAIDELIGITDNHTLETQESRCHAFYRMIGFPVVGTLTGGGTNFYSPGYDPSVNLNNSEADRHMRVANDLLNNNRELVKNILIPREFIESNFKTIFSKSDMQSTITAIMSVFIRSFELQFKDGLGPLVPDDGQKKLDAAGRDSVIHDFPELDLNINNTSYHILKPFIVDPRIELTVSPARNRICAPFLLDKSQTKLTQGNGGISLKRPYIEKVITTRFNNLNSSLKDKDKDTLLNQTLNIIKANTHITNDNSLQMAFNLNSINKSELFIFGRFIKLIRILLDRLSKNTNAIMNIKKEINWQPLPDKKGGPEKGCSLRSTENNLSNDNNRNRQLEIDITQARINKIEAETNFDLGLPGTNLGDFAFSNIDDIVLGSVQQIPTYYDRQINTMTKKRDSLGNKSNQLLREIELIMGEFSGLGLIDIIALQAALWVMKKEALVGLIDEQALSRMQRLNNLKFDINSSSRLSIEESLKEYEKTVFSLYKLIQGYFNSLGSGRPLNQPFS